MLGQQNIKFSYTGCFAWGVSNCGILLYGQFWVNSVVWTCVCLWTVTSLRAF